MSTPAPLTTHELDHRAPAETDDRVTAVTFRPPSFTPSTPDDVESEWWDAIGTISTQRGPAGWVKYQANRAVEDYYVSVEIDLIEASEKEKDGQP